MDVLIFSTEDLFNRLSLLVTNDFFFIFSGRGLQTLYYLGDLWLRLNLDLLVISRNAPGDSKWNPIEQ